MQKRLSNNPIVLFVGWLVFAFVVLTLAGKANAAVYPVGRGGETLASAVCVGTRTTDSGRVAVFLTNRHVVRSVSQLVIGGEDNRWHRARNIRESNNQSADLASFEVTYAANTWKWIRMMTDVPDGTKAQVCGYSDRQNFCLTGVMQGDEVKANGQHVIPGDSGGGVLVTVDNKKYLAGLTWAYGVRSRNSLFVPVSQCCDHLYRIYRGSPQCMPYPRTQRQQCPPGTQCPTPLPPGSYRRYERQEPRLFAPPRIERYEEYNKPETIEPPAPPKPQLSETMLKRIVVAWLEANRDRITPDVDINELGDYLAKNHADKIRGPQGPQGPPGVPGSNGTDGSNGQDAAQISVAQISQYLIANHAEELRGLPGTDGSDGADGKPGQRGLGIQEIYITDDNHVVITYTNGTADRMGPLVVSSNDTGEQSIPAYFDIVPKGQQ